jgi:hypothetical protein
MVTILIAQMSNLLAPILKSTTAHFMIFALSGVDVRCVGLNGLSSNTSPLPSLTRKRHAVSRDDICRVQERFSVIELCLLKLGCCLF